MAKDALPGIPPIPTTTDPQLRPFLQSVRDAVQLRFGQTGNQLDRSPTVRELIDDGIAIAVNYDANGNPINLGPPATGTTTNPFTDFSSPPAPTGLNVSSLPYTNLLTWNAPPPGSELIISFTEIYVNTVDDRSTAWLAGIGNASFIHAVEPMSTNYYWVRFVTYLGIAGPFNAVSGLEAISPQDPAQTLELLNNALGESELTDTLNTRVRGADREAITEDFGDNDLAKFLAVWDDPQEDLGGASILNGTTPVGDYYLRVGDNAGDDRCWFGMQRELAIPVSTVSVFKLSAWIRRQSGSGTFYVGVNGFKGDVVNGNGAWVNQVGADTSGSQHWFAASNYAPPDSNWQYVEGYFQAGASYSFNDGTLDNPHVLHPDVEYVAPVILMNRPTDPGESDVAFISLERLPGGLEIVQTLNKYAVKVDANGNVAGFGLIVEENDGATVSQFQIAVDRFAVRSPGSTDFSLVVDGGAVVMDAAQIKDATITDAKISNLSATKINAGTLNATYINLDGLKLANIGGQLSINGDYAGALGRQNSIKDPNFYIANGNADGGVFWTSSTTNIQHNQTAGEGSSPGLVFTPVNTGIQSLEQEADYDIPCAKGDTFYCSIRYKASATFDGNDNTDLYFELVEKDEAKVNTSSWPKLVEGSQFIADDTWRTVTGKATVVQTDSQFVRPAFVSGATAWTAGSLTISHVEMFRQEPDATLGATLGVDFFDEAEVLLGEIDVRNDLLAQDALNSLNFNPTFSIPSQKPSGDKGPAGWTDNHGTPAWPQYLDPTNNDIALMPTTNIALWGAAIRVEPGTKYELTALVRAQSATINFQLVASEYDSELGQGERFIVNSNTGHGRVLANRETELGTKSIGTSWDLISFDYDPGVSDGNPIWFSPRIYHSNAGIQYELDWFIVREKSVRNSGNPDLGGIVFNSWMNQRDFDRDAPLGWYGSAVPDLAEVVSYQDNNKSVLKLAHPSDTTLRLNSTAFPVSSGTPLTVRVRLRGNTYSASGLYIRTVEYDGALPEGKLAVAWNATDSAQADLLQAGSREKVFGLENLAVPSPTWTDYEGTYTPTSTAKWASVQILNWSGHGVNELWIDRVTVESEATKGATWGVDIDNLPTNLVETYYDNAQPGTGNVGDLWIDSDNNKLYRYNGSSWVEIQDDDIATAISTASGAQGTADNKIYVFAQNATPVNGDHPEGALEVGDLWIDTNDDNLLYRWNGSSWVALGQFEADWGKVFGTGKPEDSATVGMPGVPPPNMRWGEGSMTVEFVKNQSSGGGSNPGEIRVKAGSYFLPSAAKRTISANTEIWTVWENATRPPDDVFYIIWGASDVSTRFGGGSWGAAEANGLFPAIYNRATEAWQAVDNNGTTYNFTPGDGDYAVCIGRKTSTTGGIDNLTQIVARTGDLATVDLANTENIVSGAVGLAKYTLFTSFTATSSSYQTVGTTPSFSLSGGGALIIVGAECATDGAPGSSSHDDGAVQLNLLTNTGSGYISRRTAIVGARNDGSSDANWYIPGTIIYAQEGIGGTITARLQVRQYNIGNGLKNTDVFNPSITIIGLKR